MHHISSFFPTFPILLLPLSLDNGPSRPFLPQRYVLIASNTLKPLNNQPLGNQGLRYFPYSGYLGLTPIRVEGGQSYITLLLDLNLTFWSQLSAQNLMTTYVLSKLPASQSQFAATSLASAASILSSQMFSSTTHRSYGQNQTTSNTKPLATLTTPFV